MISDVTDWPALFALAARWDVEALVMFNLARFLIDYVPEAHRSLVISRERETRALNISHALVTVQLASLLEREGVRVIVIKGTAVGATAYDDVSLRGSSDVDLLVSVEDLQAARSVLEANGYTRRYELGAEASLISGGHALELSGEHFQVELHWRLLETHLRWSPDVAHIRATFRNVPCAGGEISVLARPIEFLFLCVHGVKHQWLLGKWVCDIAQLASRLSDAEVACVIELSERTRAKRILRVALRLAHEILGFSDERFEGAVRSRDRSADRLVLRAREHLLGVKAPPGATPRIEMDHRLSALISWLDARESWIDKTAVTFDLTFAHAGKENVSGAGWITRPFYRLLSATRIIARTRIA
jgi:hypothetical protein